MSRFLRFLFAQRNACNKICILFEQKSINIGAMYEISPAKEFDFSPTLESIPRKDDPECAKNDILGRFRPKNVMFTKVPTSTRSLMVGRGLRVRFFELAPQNFCVIFQLSNHSIMAQSTEGIHSSPKPSGADSQYVTSWGAQAGAQSLRRKKEINWNYLYPMFGGSSLVLSAISKS
jgi:hypothetical protein